MFKTIFIENCIICKKEGAFICNNCKKLIQIHPSICSICHKKQEKFDVCENCRSKVFLDKIVIGFKYDKYIKKLILGLKYYHKYKIARFIVEKMKYIVSLEIDIMNNNIIFTSVPTHWIKKFFVKGYNQSEVLAKYFAQYFGKQYLNICKKIRYTKSQTKLNRLERFKNIKGSFDILDNTLKLNLNNKTIIIVDDILTTGATLNEVAGCIKRYFPESKIIGIAIARH